MLLLLSKHRHTNILLDHSAERNDEDEMDADLGAYILLVNKGFKNSIDILIDNFEGRHGVKFKKSLTQRVSDKIF